MEGAGGDRGGVQLRHPALLPGPGWPGVPARRSDRWPLTRCWLPGADDDPWLSRPLSSPLRPGPADHPQHVSWPLLAAAMVTRQVLGHRVPCQTLHARGFPTDGQFARPAGGLLRGPFLPHRALDATVPTVPAPRTGPLALPSAARAFHVSRATALAGSTPPDPAPRPRAAHRLPRLSVPFAVAAWCPGPARSQSELTDATVARGPPLLPRPLAGHQGACWSAHTWPGCAPCSDSARRLPGGASLVERSRREPEELRGPFSARPAPGGGAPRWPTCDAQVLARVLKRRLLPLGPHPLP